MGHRLSSDSWSSITKGDADIFIKGVQQRYSWKDLEPSKGNYDFSDIENDLAWLKARGKRLIINFSSVEFGARATRRECVPDYMFNETDQTSGYPLAYFVDHQQNDRCFASIWLEDAWNGQAAIFTALGQAFNSDPYVEAISIRGESAVGFGSDNKIHQTASGWNLANYVTAYMNLLSHCKKAFPNTMCMFGANYLGNNENELQPLFELAEQLNGAGPTAPDLHAPGTQYDTHAYKFYDQFGATKIPQMINMQRVTKIAGSGPYDAYHRSVEQGVLDDQSGGLKVTHLIWAYRGTGQSGSSWDFEDVIVPFIRSRQGTINSACPRSMNCK